MDEKKEQLRRFLNEEPSPVTPPRDAMHAQYRVSPAPHLQQAAPTQERRDDGFMSLQMDNMPCKKYYPVGTNVLIRPATTREVQSYSTIDNRNAFDVVNKMNAMLAACVKVIMPDGRQVDSTHLKEGDRTYVTIQISALTRQDNKSIKSQAECKCNKLVDITFKEGSFVYHSDSEEIEGFYDQDRGCYSFELENGKRVELGVPTIGVQRDVNAYILNETLKKKDPNVSFMKCIPYMLWDRTSVTQEECKQQEYEFSIMDDDLYQFIYDVVTNKIQYGISELKGRCSCGREVRKPFEFPGGASALFVVPDAFRRFIKK